MTRLDVVTGFLGAGKTTFLARYLHWLRRQGVRAAVIENEFGRAGVDAAALSAGGARVREISGGCVCCTMKVTLRELLWELAADCDRILLEPSGLFCSDDLLDILHSPGCPVTPGLWLGIVDPWALTVMNDEDRAVLQSELMPSGAVWIRRGGDPDGEQAAAVRFVREVLPAPAPCIRTDPWEAWEDDRDFPALQAAGWVERPHERRRFDHAAMFQSTTLLPDRPVAEPALRAVLDRLTGGEAGTLLRVKGTVWAPDGGQFAVNAVPGGLSLVRQETRGAPALNFIGRELSRRRIREIWEEYQ